MHLPRPKKISNSGDVVAIAKCYHSWDVTQKMCCVEFGHNFVIPIPSHSRLLIPIPIPIPILHFCPFPFPWESHGKNGNPDFPFPLQTSNADVWRKLLTDPLAQAVGLLESLLTNCLQLRYCIYCVECLRWNKKKHTSMGYHKGFLLSEHSTNITKRIIQQCRTTAFK